MKISKDDFVNMARDAWIERQIEIDAEQRRAEYEAMRKLAAKRRKAVFQLYTTLKEWGVELDFHGSDMEMRNNEFYLQIVPNVWVGPSSNSRALTIELGDGPRDFAHDMAGLGHAIEDALTRANRS